MTLVDNAPRTTDTALLRARVQVTLSLSVFERGDRTGAFAILDEVDRVLRGMPTTTVHPLAVIQRAGLHGRLGEWDLARSILEQVDLGSPVVGPRARCLVHLNLGLAQQFLGQYSRSDIELRRAHQEAVAAGFPDLAVMAVHNRGRLQFLLGDLPAALALMAEARDLSTGQRPPGALLDEARVLAEAGLVDHALTSLEEGARAARESGIQHDLAETDLERARLSLLRQDPDEARRLAGRAEEQFRKGLEPAWAVRASLLGLEAALIVSPGAPGVATQLTELAEGAARTSGVGVEAAILAAEASARAGRTETARQLLTRADVRRTPSFPLRLQRTLARVTLHGAEGRPDLVRRELRRGAHRLAVEQARYTSMDSRTAVALHTSRLRRAHLDMVLRAGTAAQVFNATELWRGVSQRLPPLTASPDAEIARLTADARRLHAEVLVASDPDVRDVLESQARLAESAVARRDWESSRSRERTPEERPVTVGALRPLLEESHTGILSLFLERGTLWAVTVTPGGAQLAALADTQEIIALGHRLRADVATRRLAVGTPLEDAVAGSMRRNAEALGRAMAPVLPRSHRLVIVPSSTLASLPWRLLPGIHGRIVTIAPSATFWAGRGRHGEGPPSRSAPTIAALSGPGLQRSAREARDVARVWGGLARSATGGEATGDRLRDALRDCDIVHVAAHGRHEDESPLFSSVLMADGPVFAHEFQRSGVGAAHVVLSSCEVGRTHPREGDESLGLTASLLATGVRNVVGAVGPVGDEEAHRLMKNYHRLLAQGLDAAQALELATAGTEEGRLFCCYGADFTWPAVAPPQTAAAGTGPPPPGS